MDSTTNVNPEAAYGRPNLQWDTNTALAAIVAGALLFLILVGRGFRGFNVAASVGA